MSTPISGPPPDGAVLNLRCPNSHDLGRLIRRTGDDTIHYESAPGQPLVPWTMHTDYGYFNVGMCPGGCNREVAEQTYLLREKLDELVDVDSYTLQFVGPVGGWPPG